MNEQPITYEVAVYNKDVRDAMKEGSDILFLRTSGRMSTILKYALIRQARHARRWKSVIRHSGATL